MLERQTRRGFFVNIRRRELCQAAVSWGLLAGAFGSGLIPAWAEGVSTEELMRPGPLPDEAEGKLDAPITVIEYASMTCTHCANFAVKVYPELKARYIDTGKVRYILREFPLDAVAAAGFMLARCVGEDKYFAMINVLFRMQDKWAFVQDSQSALLSIARQAGLSEQSFKQCMTNQQLLDRIEQVRQRASDKFGVNSTPTFFINGEAHRGEMSLDELNKALEPYLKS
jgi:protein-disulfide isomerase